VGLLPGVEIDTARVDVAPGDRFVLCTDGLSAVVRDDEIAVIVRAGDATNAVDRLIHLANERGGPDNVTVQVLCLAARRNSDGSRVPARPDHSTPAAARAPALRRARLERGTPRLPRIALTLGALAVLVGLYLLSRL
jgi:serine/threonine protein phosphatase PrpC